MNPWNAASSPVHATPTKSTWPTHCCAAASTEGASALQELQVGAQNQKAVASPARSAPLNSPPPTSGAVNCNSSGTLMGVVVATASTVDSLAVAAGGVEVVTCASSGALVEPVAAPPSTVVSLAVDDVPPHDANEMSTTAPASARRDAPEVTPAWMRNLPTDFFIPPLFTNRRATSGREWTCFAKVSRCRSTADSTASSTRCPMDATVGESTVVGLRWRGTTIAVSPTVANDTIDRVVTIRSVLDSTPASPGQGS